MRQTPTTYSRLSTDAYRTLHAIGRSNLRGELKHLLTVIAGPFYDYKNGDTYPSVPRIAQYMGVSVRHVQDLVNEAVGREVLAVQRTRGGVGKTNHYQLVPEKLTPLTDEENAEKRYPSSLPNPASCAGLQRGRPRTLAQQTPHATTLNPAPGAGEQPSEQPPTTSDAAAVITLLGSDDLLRQHRPSPEQLAAIAKVAPTKDNPGGYAANCVRKGITPRFQHTPKAKRLRGGLT